MILAVSVSEAGSVACHWSCVDWMNSTVSRWAAAQQSAILGEEPGRWGYIVSRAGPSWHKGRLTNMP